MMYFFWVKKEEYRADDEFIHEMSFSSRKDNVIALGRKDSAEFYIKLFS